MTVFTCHACGELLGYCTCVKEERTWPRASGAAAMAGTDGMDEEIWPPAFGFASPGRFHVPFVPNYPEYDPRLYGSV